ncbi:MAG: mechanosensitive ion channel domain-containing protein, partial [Polyangiales bacterium]
ERRIDEMRDELADDASRSTAGIGPLAEREGRLLRRREAAERRLATVELALEATQSRYLRRPEDSTELLAEAEALTALRDLQRRHVALTDAELARQPAQHRVWSRWESLVRGQAPRGELENWEEATEEQIAALRDLEVEIAARRPEVGQSLDASKRQLASAPVGSALHRTLTEHLQTLSRISEEQQAEAAATSADIRVADRVLIEIRAQTALIDWREHAEQAAELASDVWNYEITTVDDTSITTASVVLALLLFIVGLWAARRGSSLGAQAIRRRFKLDAGAAHALQTLTFYALLTVFTLLALRAIRFPLTAFTVLGGALAIGIGFGSQNVMNNFISGLILMLERPVRAHDVVEVDGNHGTIEKIGARSTQIRSTDGRHIIVPNSFFLESNVVNWTLSDDLIRARVSVGVIYGSPTRLVEQLILKVIADDEQILKAPQPIVIFEEFGDNALNFDVYFWVSARSPMQMRIVQSRVRFQIDDVFREHELVIAFPQRDVHIDSAAPLEVRVLTEDGRADSTTKQDAT